jgi:D-glycero-alpha-D-manno-heptose-7-phosphate kinase
MIVVRAPLRISFGGGGTDLAAYYRRFGGFVVSSAINRYCRVVARPSPDGAIRIHSADYSISVVSPHGTIPAVAEPLILPRAALAWAAARACGDRLRQSGVELFLASDVPPGTGLGSSSAMAVALIRALSTCLGMTPDSAEVAELACALEIHRLGMPIGKQDQYASAFGGLNALTFSPQGVTVAPLDLAPDVLTSLSSRLLLFSTGAGRDSAQILRQQRNDTGSKPAVTSALHQIKALAQEMHRALLDTDLDRFGHLLDRGWEQKKRLSGKISSPAIDRWYAAALAAGALGGKITGAGGGGFILLYCPSSAQDRLRAAMTSFGLWELSFELSAISCQPSAPASKGESSHELTTHPTS